jgi:hypothetical protein
MRGDVFAAYPPRPQDVGEWEDLLLRWELGPRAVRLALQDHAGPADALLGCLARLLGAERRALRVLDAMRQGGTVSADADLTDDQAPDDAPDGGTAEEVLWRRYQRYAALRSQNFATLQRRGLGVWEWVAPLEGGGEVTAYRLVRRALDIDAEVLAEVRSAGRRAAAC